MKKGQTSRPGQLKNSPFLFRYEVSTTPFHNRAMKKRRLFLEKSDVLVSVGSVFVVIYDYAFVKKPKVKAKS